jgi:hypothetical protein
MSAPRLLSSAVFLTLLALLAVAVAPAPARHLETEQELLDRIQREQNPIRKAKLEIRLGRLKMNEAIGAYDQGQMEQGKSLLGTYLDRMKGCWRTLKGSGRNAVKQSQGFRELDIALREDSRTLEDLAHRISYFDRGPVEQTLGEVNRVHDEVIHALFPSVPAESEHNKPAPSQPPSATGGKNSP